MTQQEIDKAKRVIKNFGDSDLEIISQQVSYWDKKLKLKKIIKTFEELPEFDREIFELAIDEIPHQEIDTLTLNIFEKAAKWKMAKEYLVRCEEYSVED
ncbi:hypothetical protein ACVSUJ_22845 [Yersinia enterocolitica]|uniref:hypothetical protein n=1 Tax=Yersinia enterocolitica TaxID=630 RepID=UPI001C609BFB|nr:hypothetical protein [Yersinia enterocolitica]MBW5853148.1 hypothetical protein [Yersinia enterocolitica]MBX9475119.1 hypothetical protein [Yersinia enterocolitica]